MERLGFGVLEQAHHLQQGGGARGIVIGPGIKGALVVTQVVEVGGNEHIFAAEPGIPARQDPHHVAGVAAETGPRRQSRAEQPVASGAGPRVVEGGDAAHAAGADRGQARCLHVLGQVGRRLGRADRAGFPAHEVGAGQVVRGWP